MSGREKLINGQIWDVSPHPSSWTSDCEQYGYCKSWSLHGETCGNMVDDGFQVEPSMFSKI